MTRLTLMKRGFRRRIDPERREKLIVAICRLTGEADFEKAILRVKKNREPYAGRIYPPTGAGRYQYAKETFTCEVCEDRSPSECIWWYTVDLRVCLTCDRYLRGMQKVAAERQGVFGREVGERGGSA
ncbi:MAG: hypothetical protein Q8R13_00670 [bacterium]|nr:hypothetical protein [bacterium]